MERTIKAVLAILAVAFILPAQTPLPSPVIGGGSGGSGTVTSVGLTVPGILSVSGSPVTTSGTLAVSLATETANYVFAGPTSGSASAPTFRALVGADLPVPSSSTLGGIKSITALSHNWIDYIDTSGVPHQTQPAFSDLSGTATCAQLPALTGDTTTSAGSCATTTVALNGGSVPASAAVLGTNSSSQPVAATSSSVVGLFTGCSGTQYLGADGACHNSGGGVSTQSVVTGSRAFGVVYHNTNTTAMFVTVSGTTSTGGDAVLMTAITDSSSSPSTTVAQDQSTLSITGGAASLTFVVLPGNYYEATLSGNGTLAVSYWTEWH